MNPGKLVALLVCFALTGCGAESSTAEYLERARAYELDGELQAASIETRNALKGDAENREARLLLGRLQLRLGDPAAAEKELVKARELGATEAETLPRIARALVRQGKFEELRALDGEGLPAEDRASVLASRAFGHLVGDDAEAARADAAEALALDPESVEAQLMLARVDLVADDLPGADGRLRDTLDAAPESAAGWELLGDLERSTRRLDEAVAAYDRAIENADMPLGARLKRAQVHLARGEHDAARADFDALSKAGLKLPQIEVGRGRIDLRGGDLSKAQVRFEAALKLDSSYPPALGNLALTHLALGNVGQSEQYAKQLLGTVDGSDAARRLLAAIRLENGRYELAEETLDPIVRGGGRLDPFSARVLSTALLKQDRHDEAIERMLAMPRELLGEAAASDVASPLVLAQAPSRELLDEIGGGADALEREPGDEFLDENERRIARVLELLGRGENDRALEEAEALSADLPDSPVPHNLIGRVHLASERQGEARAAFERALEREENNVTAQRLLADLDLRAGDADAARARLEKALSGDGDTESVLLSLARLEAQIGDEAAMLGWLERARTDHPRSVASTLVLARYRASRAEHELVLEELGRLDERQRREPLALQLEGTSLIALRRFEEALERFDALLSLQPDAPGWRYLRAQALTGVNDSRAAVEELEKAVELSPDHAPSHLALANMEILRGDFAAAEARIDTLRDLIPGTAELDAVVARLAERRAAPAADAALRGLRIESTDGALAAARDLWTEGERDKATSLLSSWLDANPGDAAARATLANAYASTERVDAAIDEYETLLEGDAETLPEEIRLASLNNLAWYLRERDPTRAIAYAERALEVDPDSTATLDTLAMIHFGREDLDAAKAALDRAVAIGVEDPSVRYHGAQIEAALGNTEAARALLVPLVDGAAEFPERDEAVRLLDEIGRSGN